MPNKHSSTLKQQAATLAEQGATVSEIAYKLNISYDAARRYAGKYARYSNARYSNALKAAAVADYIAGMTAVEVAKKYSVKGHKSVLDWVRAAGASCRDVSSYADTRCPFPYGPLLDTASRAGVTRRLHKDYWLFPYAKNSGYMPEGRRVAAEYLGRPLSDNERVYHMNGKNYDNRVENLRVVKDGVSMVLIEHPLVVWKKAHGA